MNPVQATGRASIAALRTVGRAALFGVRGLAALVSPPWFLGQTGRQLLQMGYFSLPVVGLTAVFTGAALALNIYTGGGRFNAEQIMPQIVALGITRELGPVLAALMLAGRVSAAIAAEIGAMRATEQIDAMQTLSTDPFRYLIAPRLAAAVIDPAAADRRGRHHRHRRRLGGGDPHPELQCDHLRPQHLGLHPGLGRGVRPDQGGGVRLHRRPDRLLPRLLRHAAARAGSGGRTTHAVVSAAVLIFASDYLLTSVFTRHP